MSEGDNCIIIQECFHPFHRSCIESHLANSADCPICKRPCQPSELREVVILTKTIAPAKSNTIRGKGRGAMSKTYNTRSTSRNLFNDPQSSISAANITPSRNAETLNQNVDIFSPVQGVNNTIASNSGNINYDQISRMIEASLARLLQGKNIPSNVTESNSNNMFSFPNLNNQNMNTNRQLNISANNNQQPVSDNVNFLQQQQPSNDILPRSVQNFQPNPNNFNTQAIPNIPSQNCHPQIQASFQQNSQNNPPQSNNNNPPQMNCNSHLLNLSNNSFLHSNNTNMPLDKITSIIQNWNLKFDGSSNGLNVEEFLYRLKSLTSDYFNGDYSVICRNLNSLLTGKARDWYWRYHKQVQYIEWNAFCEALRSQYKEFKSSFDLREEIRSRKQKPNETFDNFFESVSAMMDKLPRAMSEAELIEILARNLRPDIRQDLLYVPIHSISHLRRLVQMRENFFSDEYVRKNLPNRNFNPFPMPRRIVAEIAAEQEEVMTAIEDTEGNISALQNSESSSTCWNCDQVGHHWQDCLHVRTIFCYGCGAKNTYKPKCTKCANRKQMLSKNLRQMGPQVDQV